MRVSDKLESAPSQTGVGSSIDVHIEELIGSDMCEHDVSGEWLDPKLVADGCAEEIRRCAD